MTVFVSYKAEDRNRVAPLVEALEADGLSIWWDAHIGGGDDWRETILRHLEAARCVIVIWSKGSTGPHGQFVRDEATRALRRRSYLPVRIDKVEPPLGFGETQALDLQGWNGDRNDPGYAALLSAIQARLGMDPSPRPVVPRRRGVTRRTAIAGGGVAALAATGIGAWLLIKPGGASSDSIAVLPFANLSGDPAQAYFSDGIAEELRNALSRIAGLTVVARTSSEAVRNADAKSAAQKLGVANILTGSVRRSPHMVRISAQLVDGRKGIERWSEIYDRPIGDALQIQTDIANKVAEALSIHLGGADRQRLGEGGTKNAEAQDLLLRARAGIRQGEGRQIWERAIGTLDAALALDPSYAEAMVAKARMLKVLAGAYAESARESHRLYREAEITVRRAIQLAPRYQAGHSTLGEILYQQLQPRAALVEYEKMLALPGEDAEALIDYAIFLAETRRTDEALRLIDRAVAADPLNPLAHSWRAYVLAAARRYPEAIESMRRVAELAPSRTQPRRRIGYYLMLLGRYAEAAKAMNVPDAQSPIDLTYRATLAARMGNRAEAERILAQLRAGGDYGHFQVAQVLAQLGRKDEAIGTLESAWDSRDSGLTTILIDPLLDPLRGDARFEAIVKRIDFPV